MMRSENRRAGPRGITASLGVLAFALLLGSAEARPPYYNIWLSRYPSSMSGSNVLAGTGASCQLCHSQSSGGVGWNGYGFGVRQQINTGKSVDQALAAIEGLDSDNDPLGATNLVEILASTQPGWTAGPHNTLYDKSGPTATNQNPPAGILGGMDPCTGSLTTYCTAKTNSLGCVPSIAGAGTPSATAASGFVLTGSNVRNQKPGLSFYKVNGSQANAVFQCGALCVGPSGIKRTPARSAGGNPSPANDCSGVYLIDMNAFAQGLAGGTPQPALLVAGNRVHTQWWGRDQGFGAPCNTTLSDGLQYDICI